MTENEAKQVLDNIWDFVTPEDDCLGDFVENALYVVDSIFEEIQQYRAIGTVEQLEWCKDASHWKELFKEKLEKYEAIGTVEELQDMKNKYQEAVVDWRQYRKIGTIEEFKALKEKSVAKKVVVEHIPKTSWTKEISHYLCPSCRSIFSFGGKPYCSNCGQKLDWQ